MAIDVAARASNGAVSVAPPISEADREILAPWIRRRDLARTDRRRYEYAWSINQFFAAGIQWLASEQTTGRIMEDPNARDKRGRPLDVVDVLSQYNGTVIGKLAQGDMRPELLSLYDNDEQADLYAEQLNAALGYAWAEETKADRRFLAILRTLVELGTAAVRCRVDRVSGQLIAPEWPHANGQPLLGDGEAQQHMEQMFTAGLPVDMRPLREAKLALEKLSPWNLLPPPGIEDPDEFPHELIVRPVFIPELKMVYGAKALGVTADKIEDMGMLSYQVQRYNLGSTAQQPAVVSGLKEHALTYTGYLKPNNEYPNGQTVVFTHDGHLLDMAEQLPYTQSPWGPRSGITYFRWGILEGRFWGRAFMEPGIGPQKIRNKRSSQIDLIIDSGMPKIFIEEGSIDTSKLKGIPNEIVKVKPGATLPKSDGGIQPGAALMSDLELQDTNIQKALGIYGVGLGENPQAVTTYGQLALLNENESTKFGPIAQDFKLGVCDVVRDMVEAMRQWPADKQVLIAGDENALRALAFNAKAAVPPAYLVRPASGSALPRSEGAELQKVTDIMNQAVATGVAVTNAAEWIDWYVRSLNAGKALPIPTIGLGVEQRRKAALENVVMVHTGQVLPVAPEDDAQIHVTEHDEEIARLQESAAEGDVRAGQLVQVIEQHKQLHLEQAQKNAGQVQSSLPPAGRAPGPPGSPPPPAPAASPAGGLPASTPQ